MQSFAVSAVTVKGGTGVGQVALTKEAWTREYIYDSDIITISSQINIKYIKSMLHK